MAELDERLNSILNDPQAMERIVGMAKALAGETASSPPGGGTEDAAGEPVEPEAPGAGPSAPPGPAGGGESPLSALGQLDPRLLSGAMRLLSEYNASDDRRTALLAALAPFLKEERRARMDKAVQLAKLSRVIKAAFQLFQQGGADHV